MPAPDDVRIGDFSKSPVPTPAATAKTASPLKESLESAERKLGAEAKAVETELRPMAAYEEKLASIGVSKEQAARIVNAILSDGYWAETIPLTKTFSLRLRTRNTRDRERATSHIENMRPMYDAHYQDLMAKQIAAASLETFGPHKFDHAPAGASTETIESMFERRIAFVRAMADPAYGLLIDKLRKFDEKIRVVMEEGAIENF